ncbi:Protein of unknown function DUF863, plant [Dillenia turbinata]|uniref:Uncharacterized protein n=1 Tax=Dillenia turbinata TaxID=194707 RepID=A0AAN8VKV5_9MAGN
MLLQKLWCCVCPLHEDFVGGMGTKVQSKSYLPGFHSMRDLNEGSSNGNWPLYYGDNTLSNGPYYNRFLPNSVPVTYPGYDVALLKQTMLRHEAIFKNQVYELHRLYRIQRDLMDEAKRKQMSKHRIPLETSSSSSPFASEMPSDDAHKWNVPGFSFASSRPSISGSENTYSPYGSVKGRTQVISTPLQNGGTSNPLQNGGTSKDCEMLVSRPSKVRRKIFDLHLPADEYLDTEEGEHMGNGEVSAVSTCNGNKNFGTAQGDHAKMLISGGQKNAFQGDASRTDSLPRVSGLADLNEPIQVEEATTLASAVLVGPVTPSGEMRQCDPTKLSSGFLGLPREHFENSEHASTSGTKKSTYVENRENGWLSKRPGINLSKSYLDSKSQGFRSEKFTLPSQSIQGMLDKAQESQFAQNKGGLRAAAEISEKNHSFSNFNHLEPPAASRIPDSFPFFPASSLPNAWAPSISNWGSQTDKFSQKLSSNQTFAFPNSYLHMSESSSLPAEKHGAFRDKQIFSSNVRSDPSSCGNDSFSRNGFYPRSSGSKETPIQSTTMPCGYLSNAFTSSVKSSKDLNLNEVLTTSSSHDVVSHYNLEVYDRQRKQDATLAVLPSLIPKFACDERTTEIRRDSKTVESNFLHELPGSHAHENRSERIIPGDCPSNNKITGVSIFGKNHIFRTDLPSLISPSPSIQRTSGGEGQITGVIDINLPCDSEAMNSEEQFGSEILSVHKEIDVNVSGIRNDIDLNLCLSDDETSPSVSGTKVKKVVGIDLEAPALPETMECALSEEEALYTQHDTSMQSPEQKADAAKDELAQIAAEAIVAISSSCHHNHVDDASYNQSESSVIDPLQWFVDVVSSFGDDLENKLQVDSRSKSNDNDCLGYSSDSSGYFESMTLKLTETNVEEYLSRPQIPESPKVEDPGANMTPTRPRRGPGRRGRQRRDFQRDILPGLASLSRHEVTEDLQTFGGLMRATGHSWHSGVARRNAARYGCGRGRRRSLGNAPAVEAATAVSAPPMQQLNGVEMGLEDRSLTGWGKTTRRPRRQRCPAGNILPIHLN